MKVSKSIIASFLFLCFILFAGCEKKNNSEVIPAKTITTDNQAYSTYEIITVQAQDFDFTSSGITCKLGGNQVSIIPGDSKSLYIMVPAGIASGQQKLLIESKDLSATTLVTINTVSTFSQNGKVYLKNYIDTLVAQLNKSVKEVSDVALKDTLNLAISKLQTGKATVDQLTESQADILSKYIYANRKAMQEFDDNLAGIDKSILSSGEQRITMDGYTTVQKYQKCLEGIAGLLKGSEFKKAGKATILTGLLGIADAGEAVVDLFKAILNGEWRAYIQKAKSTVTEITDWMYWAPVPFVGAVIDNVKQSISNMRVTSETVEVHNNTDLTFNNFKATYRNMQESDKTSSYTSLAGLATTFVTVRDMWNSMAGKLYGMGTIDFSPAKTQNKTVKDLNGFTVISSNPAVTVSPVSGTVSSFKVNVSTAKNDVQSGELTLKYIDEIGQMTESRYALSVLPAVDSIPIYKAAITGNWTMTWQDSPTAQIDKFKFNSDGTGTYYWMKVAGQSTGAPIDPQSVVYNIVWSVYKSDKTWFLRIDYPKRGWSSTTEVYLNPAPHSGIDKGTGLYFLGKMD